jgi:SPP1 gp7 family putative phage head morphogenesis protein
MDEGFKQSEKMLNELEAKLHKEYLQATKEMTEKVDKYFAKFKDEDEKQKARYEKGEITKKEYTEWRKRKMLTGKRYTQMRDTLASDLTKTAQIAMKYVDNKAIDVYALNMNYETYNIEHETRVDTSFTLYNHDAVQRLIKENPELLPQPKVDVDKSERWNLQHIQSAITQGILQGEAIPKIAKRMQRVTNMERSAAIRNARTAMTGAQNGGRLDSMKRAQGRGIEVKKGWLATLDGRTRDSHAVMDGEEVELDEKFSNGLRFPGDPNGAPSHIYNCRCRMVHVFPKYRTDWSNMENRNTEKLGNMSYEEWKNNHKERLEKKKTKTKEITSNKAKESLSYIENRDSKLSYEKGAIIGANGDILKEYDGTKHAVEVTDEDLQLMQGITFTHNHPNGGFFSDNDIKTGFIKTHLGELRASTPQGTVYVLKDNNATLEDAQKYLAEYSQTSMRARRTAQEHFIRMIKSGDLSKDYYDKHYFELLQQYRDEKLIAMTKEKAKDFNLIFEVQKIEK